MTERVVPCRSGSRVRDRVVSSITRGGGKVKIPDRDGSGGSMMQTRVQRGPVVYVCMGKQCGTKNSLMDIFVVATRRRRALGKL